VVPVEDRQRQRTLLDRPKRLSGLFPTFRLSSFTHILLLTSKADRLSTGLPPYQAICRPVKGESDDPLADHVRVIGQVPVEGLPADVVRAV
jgi:hypothetical protein